MQVGHVEIAHILLYRFVGRQISIIADVIICILGQPARIELMAIVFGDDFQPHRQRASEPEVLKLAATRLSARNEDVEIDLVDQLNGALTVGVVARMNRREERITLPVEIFFRDECVPAQNRMNYLPVSKFGNCLLSHHGADSAPWSCYPSFFHAL